MANRSDFNSTFPRFIKRMLALSRDLTTEARHREVRMLFIKAHGHAQVQRKIMLTQKGNVDLSTAKDNKESDQPTNT